METGMRLAMMAAQAAWFLAAGTAQAQEPPLVAAYTRGLAEQCGPLPPGAAAPNLIDRADLNGDGQNEWIVDAGRYPCPGRSAPAVATGAQVTVFTTNAAGGAVPVFQRSAFGSRLQRTPDGTTLLVMTLGGADCGDEDAARRCERRLTWQKRPERFALAPLAATPPSALHPSK